MAPPGERNGGAKLSAQEALAVFRLAWSGLFWQREIADAYGVSQSQVSLIMHKREWRCLWKPEGTGTMAKIEIEQSDLDELKARVAELEKAREPAAPIKPAPRRAWDPTARIAMPKSAVSAMAAAAPDKLMADLRADALKPNPVTQSVAQLTPDRGGGRVQIERGTGWAAPNPMTPPAGVALCDRLVDMQDAIDKADLQRRLARSKE
jgi:hypothetical protein